MFHLLVQLNFIKAGGIPLLQSIFVSNNVIMRTSTNIMRYEASFLINAYCMFIICRSCFLSTVKMCKLIFISIGYATISVVAKALKSDNPPSTHVHQSASVLQAALHRIVPNVEHSHKNAALHISKNLMQHVCVLLPYVTGFVKRGLTI